MYTDILYARFEVFMVVEIEFVVFWAVALCSVVVRYQFYRGLFCLLSSVHNNPENYKFRHIIDLAPS
jgi:hypothetical protein